ncbi:MAG: DUF167 domain-containing protein [Verrucomicrobia bacterium]|nr:DUF167 domain-containing protein [Verrucomicrobiota bacterium]
MILTVKVVPRARKNEIAGYENGILKVRLKAVPEKGQANEELIDFLAEELELPKSSLTLVRGRTGRLKHVKIEGLDETQFLKRYV